MVSVLSSSTVDRGFESRSDQTKDQGRIQGWGAPGARAKIGKNNIFLRKIVIFHTKYLKNVRASLRSAQFF